MRLTQKVLIPLLILMIAVFGLLAAYYYSSTSLQLEAAEAQELSAIYQSFQQRLQQLEDFSVALALSWAADPQVQQDFAARNREALIEDLYQTYVELDEKFDLAQGQFHLPPATSFLRLHQLDRYGDDLTSFRKTVVDANQKREITAGVEIGRGGLGVRGVVPVMYQGQHLGTFEIGMDIGQKALNEIKAIYGKDLQLLLWRVPAEIATFVPPSDLQVPYSELLFQVSTLTEPIFSDEDSYRRALQGESIVTHQRAGGKEYAIFSAPLYDYSGQIIGVVDILSEHSAVVAAQRQALTVSLVIFLAGVLATNAVMGFVVGSTVRPIRQLTQAATAFAAGDLSRSVEVNTRDEVGRLAEAFNQMGSQLRELIGSLEQRVAERTRALQATSEISQRLSTLLDLDDLVKAVVDEIQQAFNYYHVQIYLVDPKDQSLAMVGGTGEAGRALLERGHRIGSGRGLVGRAASTVQPVLVADTRQDPSWLPNPLLPDTQAEIAVPIVLGDRVLGVLDVQQNRLGGLGEEDLNLLRAVANQVAIAVQNARLYQAAQTQAEREAVLNLISQKIQASETIDEALQVAAVELSQALEAAQTRIELSLRAKGNGNRE